MQGCGNNARYDTEYDLARYFLTHYEATDLEQSSIIKASEELLVLAGNGIARNARLNVTAVGLSSYIVFASEKQTNKTYDDKHLLIETTASGIAVNLIHEKQIA